MSTIILCFLNYGFCTNHEQGLLITFAGISGSGKSTLARELAHMCNAKIFLEPEENEWPEHVRNKHPYSDFTAYSCVRGFRVDALLNAWKLRKNGELVITDSCYDKITSYYLGKPGMDWLISRDDPYFACVEMLTKIDTANLPDPDCIIFINISFEDWMRMLIKRGRIRDSIEGFRENYEKYSSYIREAVAMFCKDRNIKLVVFSTEFGDPKTQAARLLKQLEHEKIIMNESREETMQTQIYDLLSKIDPIDEKEEEHIAFAKKWVLSGKELFRKFKPDVPDIHLVAYCLLIDFEKNKILLGAHKDAGLWLPPGGHCDYNELPLKTAERELMEEMGVTAEFYSSMPFFLSVTKTSGPNDRGHTDVGFWYISCGDSTQKIDYDRVEFNELKWFSFNEVPLEMTDHRMESFLKKLKNINK